MGFIEEGRQLFQDFVAPEIRAIDARLSAVEKHLESLESKVDRVQTVLESKIDRNHTQVMDALHRMENYTLVMERLARVEAKLQNVA
jgi:tetrahydromethanopterin S-methyltransferase subunit G